MNNPFLSVIIPLYNNESLIERCVNSILAQPFRDLEIIIVNDGSKDNSAEIADALAVKHQNIQVVHQSNAGVSAARNHGIHLAKGNYLVFCDSDDLWIDNVLTHEFVNDIVSNPAEVICCGFFRRIGSAQVKLSMDGQVGSRTIGPEFIHIPYSKYHVCSQLYLRSFIRKYDIMFKEGLKVTEDKLFVDMCFYCSDTVRFIDHPFYVYFDNPASFMNSKWDAFGTLMHGFNGRMWESQVLAQKRSYGAAVDATTIKILQALAVGCILEMLQAHFSNSLSMKRARQQLEHYGLTPYLDTYEQYYSSGPVADEFRLFQTHPYLFAWKYRIKGFIRSTVRRLLPKSMVEKKRLQNASNA